MIDADETPQSPPMTAETSAADVPPPAAERLDSAETASVAPPVAPTVIEEFVEPPAPIPGPGLLEAFAWMFLVFGLHIVGGVAAILWIAVVEITQTGSTAGLRSLGKFTPEQWLMLAAGEQLVVTVLTLILVAVRLGGQVTQRLNLSRPTLAHTAIIALLMFPLSVLCSEFYRLNQLGWKWLGTVFPALQALDELSSVEMVGQLAEAAGLDLLIITLAVGPAINEELIFRGLLGRGLVARRGWLQGVLICSVMFGVVHLHPSHVAAVIPLGVAMHFLYITTRSFWAPVLLHFLNNTWAAVAAKLAADGAFTPEQVEQPVSPAMVLLAALTAWALGIILWKSRIRDILPDGSVWSPGYRSLEAPAEGVARRQMSRISASRFALAGAVAVVFHVLLFATESAPKEPVQEQPAGRVGFR